MNSLEKSGITAPKGFLATGTTCGIKKSKKLDIGVIYSKTPAIACGMFTQNRVKASSVVFNKKVINNPIHGITVNSGNANSCTGNQGIADTKTMATLSEKNFNTPKNSFLVCSTGIIGEKLPMNKIESGIKNLSEIIHKKNNNNFAKAILTTDLKTKQTAVEIKIGNAKVRIGGACKGSGMIEPNMATMLAFITTDLKISKTELQPIFKRAVNKSFNSITVDGDSSTNDSVLLLANGMANNKKLNKKELVIFEEALSDIMIKLAKMIVLDGEGATKLASVKVTGAKTESDAKKVAKAIANSNLVKTALFGNDPNWGRILCAAGYSGAKFKENDLSLWLCNTNILKNGQLVSFNKKTLANKMKKKEIDITVNIGKGKKETTVWTCDLSYDYVKINAEYHT